MKKGILFVIILLFFVGCSRETRYDEVSEIQVSEVEKEDKEIFLTGKNEFSSFAQSAEPYSIFDMENDFSVGDVVVIGNYSHEDKDYGGYPYLPVQWLVLEKKEDAILLLSLYSVDTEPYYDLEYMGEADLPESVSWENCSLRKWLNEDFMQSTFLETEQECIKQVAVQAFGNSVNGISGSDVTWDYLFLLSKEEVKQYLETEAKRITHTVPKVEQGYSMFGEEPSEEFFDGWWIRTSGKDTESVLYVNQQGEIVLDGAYVESGYIAVRPAMWVDLDKVEQISETMNDVTLLEREANYSKYKSEGEYRSVLKSLWELNEGENSEESIKALGLSIENVTENHLYDNSSRILPFSEGAIEKIREIGKHWSNSENKGFIQRRFNFVLLQYNGLLHTQLKDCEQYWETPLQENQYIPRNFTIEEIAGTKNMRGKVARVYTK